MLFYYSNGKWNKEDYEHFQYDVIQMILHKVVAKKTIFAFFGSVIWTLAQFSPWTDVLWRFYNDDSNRSFPVILRK